MKTLTYRKHIELLKLAALYRNKIDWPSFAKGRKDFPEYAMIPFPFARNSTIALAWQNYFSTVFGCRVHYNFTVRLLNSFVITAA